MASEEQEEIAPVETTKYETPKSKSRDGEKLKCWATQKKLGDE